jgi:hypothetical protein
MVYEKRTLWKQSIRFSMDIPLYIERVLDEHRLDDEILRIQNVLLGLTKQPHPDKAVQVRKVQVVTEIFKALLSAKEAREKAIQEVREDHRRSAENGSTCPTNNAPRRIGVWNVLKQKFAGR